MADEKSWFERAKEWRRKNIAEPVRSTDIGRAWGELGDRYIGDPLDYLFGGDKGAKGDIKEWAQDAPVKWWQSYDDDTPRWGGTTTQGKLDRAKDFFIDMPAHGIVNAAQWLKDLGTQGFEVIENLEPTWLGGEGRPLLTKEQKYKLDAWEGNPFGNYYVDEEGNVDNPYINPVYDEQGNIKGYNNQAYLRMKADSERRAQKEFNEKIFTPEVEKKLLAEVDKAITWEDWRTDKKNKKRHFSEFHKDKQDYYEQLISERYDDDFQKIWLEDMDRSFMENYQIGYTDDEGRRVGDKGAFSDWDWSEDQWRPPHSMFGYNTDDKRFLRQMEIIPELAADWLLWKGVGKGAKSLKQEPMGKGVMENVKRIEGPGSRFDWAEEWLRQRGG